MRRLMILRHAKTEPAGHGPDFDRALAGRGPANARAIGAYMKSQGYDPDFAAVSPARRAVETWEKIAAELAKPPRAVFDPRIYNASENALLAVVHGIPRPHKSAVLVGHNPGFALLADMLAGSGSRQARERLAEKFPTAALAIIDFDAGDWKDVLPGEGRLREFVTPADLKS
jgi:phosphohistidine phosphatase